MKPIEARKEFFRIADHLDQCRYENTTSAIYQLRLAARRLGSIGIRECNGVTGPNGFAKWDDADQAKADRERARAEQRAIAALESCFDISSLTIEFQGDPRGPSFYVKDGNEIIATFW